jgi:ribonuclease P protein component
MGDERPHVTSRPRRSDRARARPNGLPRALRIRQSRDFRRLERQALKGSNALVTALVRPCRPERSRVGFTVSKKVSNRAVVRNRVKRLMREIVRTNKSLFEGLELILIAREPAAEASLETLRQAVGAAVTRARAAVAERPRGRPPEKRGNGAPPRGTAPPPSGPDKPPGGRHG